MTGSSPGGPMAARVEGRHAPAAGLRLGKDREIELKLDVALQDGDRLAASAFFIDAPEMRQESTYFDTVTDSLQRSGLSLRIRRTGQRQVQTIKSSGVAAGVFARSEWERDVAGAKPVLDEADAAMAVLADSSDRLEPSFRVDVTRRTAQIERHGGSVEIVLDRGRILAGGQSEPVSELELELKSGDPVALFAMAREIDAIVPLRLGVLSKPERGYRLREVDPDKPVKSEPTALDEAMTAAAGFQAIAYACLRQFRLNEALLGRTGAADALHQLRVALRRLRSALSIFKPVVADARVHAIRTELRWITGALAEARNIDVLLDRIPDESAALPLREARERAYGEARRALDSPRLRALMLDLAEWIATGAWLAAAAEPARRDRPLADFARDALDRYRRRVKRSGHGLVELDDDDRHGVRIQAKKLRYSAEFFAPLFHGERRTRRRERFLAALEALQAVLGDLNDFAIAPGLLERLGLGRTPLAGALTPDFGARRRMLEGAGRAYRALVAAKPFWW